MASQQKYPFETFIFKSVGVVAGLVALTSLTIMFHQIKIKFNIQ